MLPAVGFFLGSATVGAFAWMFNHYAIRRSRAREWVRHGARLIDVDSTTEFLHHHPGRALHIPLADLSQRAHELGDHAQPVVVFAHDYWRGARAVRELRAMGYWDVLNAAGLKVKEVLDATTDATTREKNTDLEELASTKN